MNLKSIVASIISTIVGAVILGGLLWAVEGILNWKILVSWTVIYFVVTVLLFSFIFKKEIKEVPLISENENKNENF